MAIVNDKQIYEVKEWLNDTPQNRAVLGAIVNIDDDITVVQLNVTENDTYVAPSGVAYSPVVVNVAGGAVETADVTFINTAENRLYTITSLPHIVNNELVTDLINPGADSVNEVVITIPLYDGKAFIPIQLFSDYDITSAPVLTGDISVDNVEQVPVFAVTGDGSISLVGTGR